LPLLLMLLLMLLLLLLPLLLLICCLFWLCQLLAGGYHARAQDLAHGDRAVCVTERGPQSPL
jgi:hypothetical protein